MSPPRVLVLSHMYPRLGNPTAGVFIREQVRHLKRQGCEIMVVSPGPYVPGVLVRDPKRETHYGTASETVMDGVPVAYPRYLRLPGRLFHGPSSFTLYLAAKRAIRDRIEQFRPQLIHAHTATPDGYAGMLLRRKLGLPLVVSFRGSDINVYPHRDRFTLQLTRSVITGADRTVAVSDALRAAAARIARPRKETAVVYTGCDLERFSFDEAVRRAIRERLGIQPEAPVLVFVGRVQKTKGIFELMEAFALGRKEHAGLRLIVVGGGEDASALAKAAAELRVGDRVHFVGTRPKDEISHWLSAADIHVLPSWREGLPNVVVEAMACQRPVVATRVGGIPEAVQDGETGILVEKGDVNALAEAIIGLARDPKLRARMGAAGRRVAEERFTWEKNVRTLLRIYEEVYGCA